MQEYRPSQSEPGVCANAQCEFLRWLHRRRLQPLLVVGCQLWGSAADPAAGRGHERRPAALSPSPGRRQVSGAEQQLAPGLVQGHVGHQRRSQQRGVAVRGASVWRPPGRHEGSRICVDLVINVCELDGQVGVLPGAPAQQGSAHCGACAEQPAQRRGRAATGSASAGGAIVIILIHRFRNLH